MAEKDYRKYLHDVLLAIEGIESFAKGLSISQLEVVANKWALERGMSIIGEALNKARKANPSIQVTHLWAIISLRHIVVHDYDIVDNARLLSIVNNHLPILKSEVIQILETTS
jgi:uncharacterized protein with HEPN domain